MLEIVTCESFLVPNVTQSTLGQSAGVILFAGGTFTDVIKLSLLVWVLIQQDWCPYKKRMWGHTHAHTDHHVPTGAEMGISLDFKEHQESPAATRSWRRPGTDTPRKDLPLAMSWFETFGLQDDGRMNSCYFKTCGVWKWHSWTQTFPLVINKFLRGWSHHPLGAGGVY